MRKIQQRSCYQELFDSQIVGGGEEEPCLLEGGAVSTENKATERGTLIGFKI
jgi:hypothetical protein